MSFTSWKRALFPTVGLQWRFKCDEHFKFFFCCECFLFGYFDFNADKILRVSEIPFLEVMRLRVGFSWFSRFLKLSAVQGSILCVRSIALHLILTPHAGRYFAQILSCRQFEYSPAWEYCVVFRFSFELKRHASFILWISSFMVSFSCTLLLLDRTMGCGC